MKQENYSLLKKSTIHLSKTINMSYDKESGDIIMGGRLGKSNLKTDYIYNKKKGINKIFELEPIYTHLYSNRKFSKDSSKNVNKTKFNLKLFSNLAEKELISLQGLLITLLENSTKGICDAYLVNLNLVGVGYKASIEENHQNKTLVLKIGYSHQVHVDIPNDIILLCNKPTTISIIGTDKQKVSQLAWNIRKLRKPEPYKGKGIKLSKEIIRRKESKKK